LKCLADILSVRNNFQKHHTVYSITDGHEVSYISLEQKIQALKRKLINENFDNQKRIGILVANKPICFECIGAIIKSKNVYVPLDFYAPFRRNLYVIQNNCLHALFIETAIYEEHKNMLPEHHINYKEKGYLLISFQNVKEVTNIPTDLAYILNTSGSTGKPKGVMIRHENALAFINWAADTFKFNADDKFTSVAPFHFDLSIFDLYVPIKCGGNILFFEPEDIKNPLLLAKHIAEKEITVMYATPTILMLLLRYGKLHKYDFSSLRYVFFAGEVFPIEPLKQLKEKWTHVQFCNWYGPTETNVCTYHEIPATIDDQFVPFPIGKECLPNTTKVEADGELLVSGPLVTPGYWNNAEKNKLTFTTDEAGIRWYRTGDLVEVNNTGAYVFKGRKDRMIKRRGYRIELDELEHVLRKYTPIETAAIVSKRNNKNIQVIIAYYTLKQDSDHVEKSDLRDHLLSFLPMYMLPDHFQEISTLPKTSTHKTDYQKLALYAFN